MAVWSIHLLFLFLGRSLMMDLVDLQGDALMGRDTIPLALGVDNSRKLLSAFIAAQVLLMAAAAILGMLPFDALFALIGSLWLAAGYSRISRTPFPGELVTRVAGDGALLAAGAGPIVYRLLTGG
jgi:4-hydroxy-3-methylbut-2-enyl diphosphate reductase